MTRGFGPEGSPASPPRGRLWLLAGLGALMVGVAVIVPPIPQDPAYHDFADRRGLLGVPNALNVLSNLPFLVVGAAGLAFLARDRSTGAGTAFLTAAERQPYWLLFAGVALTGIGSAYYHWTPDNATLFWDRLPMTIAFMALLSSVIAERIDLTAGLRLLAPLLAVGVLSTLYWHVGEQRGAGDLRPYALVQFGTLVAIPLIAWLFPPRYTGTADLVRVLGWYALAKVFESFDHGIFHAVGVSGHTLKHLASAVGAWWIVRMIERRLPVAGPGRVA
jgi:Ceramidase